MTAQDLKNSILQLAIQGKLVEQRSEEGTAEELYQRIQAEKKKLIEDGKIVVDKKHSPKPISEDDMCPPRKNRQKTQAKKRMKRMTSMI